MAWQPAALRARTSPPAGAGDHDSTGHAEGRRGGTGWGFDLSVGSDDGGEAESHGADTADEKDTGAGEVRTHAAVDLSSTQRAPKRGAMLMTCGSTSGRTRRAYLPE